MNLNTIQQIRELLANPKKIAVVPHRNPDGDAYGSALALYHYLKKNGHEVHVVSPNEAPEYLKWLPGADQIVIFENDTARATALLEDAEVVFTLDFNALHRVGKNMQEVLERITPFYILIDHHPEPEEFADIIFHDDKVSSTCQMIYRFFDRIGVLHQINRSMATCLYTGIMTDTGSFRFSSTTGETHRIAAELLDKGIDHSRIHDRIYENTYKRIQLLGRALSNLKLIRKYRTAYITLSNDELRKFDYKKGDTEGFVNYALSLKDVVLAAIFIEDEQQGIIKISFRSKGRFSVNELARKHFNGGGHINAAGGRTELSLKETVEYFKKILPEYEEKIIKNA